MQNITKIPFCELSLRNECTSLKVKKYHCFPDTQILSYQTEQYKQTYLLISFRNKLRIKKKNNNKIRKQRF